jgi:glycosyltransferase involved in cell wall biosynthesis
MSDASTPSNHRPSSGTTAPMPTASRTHLVLIPSYNPGEKVDDTVRRARAHWTPVWVIVDGSTDGSTARLEAMAKRDPGLRVIVLPRNRGKGAAVLAGLNEAAAHGFTHALTMDSDGQHPADLIGAFMAASMSRPDCMVLGYPKFDESAPRERVLGRKLSNACANIETLWAGIGDSLFGFRVYPIAPLRAIMSKRHGMRGFDFDPEAAVRLCWEGIRPINVDAPVRYFTREEGGISHFHYVRTNGVLVWMYLKLLFEFAWRLPQLIVRRFS